MESSGSATPAGAWKPLVICPHSGMASRIRPALAHLGFVSAVPLNEYPPPGSIAELRRQHGSNLCFIDVATDQDRGLALISETAGSCPVVALNPSKEADLILRCLRRGACEFLVDSAQESLASLFERLSPTRAAIPQRHRGKLYCAIPGKPGCGASTLAAHFAVELRTAPDARVLLVDTDPLTGSISFMLKLKSEFHLDDVLRDWQRMDQDLWSRLTARFGGVDVLLAPQNPSTRMEIGSALAGEMLSFWRERYDAIVMDCADLRAAVDTGFAGLADTILLVTTNELAALHATKRSLEFLDQAVAGRERLRLIVNRYTPATGLKREDLFAALEIEPFAVLSNDYELIQSALLDGKTAPPGSRFRTSIQHLIRELEPKPSGEKKANGWFRRLKSRQ